jgi:prepilin-type processing-associated H-X9-DG protein
VIVCYTRAAIYPGGRNVLRADGSVRFVQEETLHDPTMPPDVSLRDSYEVVVEALGARLTPERDAELRRFYEVEH